MQLPFKVSLPALLKRLEGRCRRTYDYAKHKIPFPKRTKTNSGSTESEVEVKSQSIPRRRTDINPNSQFWTVNEERDLQDMLATIARQQEEEARNEAHGDIGENREVKGKVRDEVNGDIGENIEVEENTTTAPGEMRRNARPNSLHWEFEPRPHSHHIRPEDQWGTRPARWSSGPFLPDNRKFAELE